MGSFDFINTTITGITGVTTTGPTYVSKSIAISGIPATETHTGISAYVAFPAKFSAPSDEHMILSSSNIPAGLTGGALYFVNGLLVSSSAVR